MVGDASTHGSFETFVATVLRGGVLTVSDRTTMETELAWAASGASLRMGWEGDLVYNDGQGDSQTATLGGYARYESPWVSSSFPAADELVITQGNNQLVLDFASGTRTERIIAAATTSAPTAAPTTPVTQVAEPTAEAGGISDGTTVIIILCVVIALQCALGIGYVYSHSPGTEPRVATNPNSK